MRAVPGFRGRPSRPAACLFVLAAVLPAQTDRFAVATIKPTLKTGDYTVAVNGRRFFTYETSVKDLIDYAYMLHASQIVGGPEWMESEKFDVEAKADGEGRLKQPESRAMVQQLLAERFHFAFHRDHRELAIYEIVATNESRLKKSAGDPNAFGTVGFHTFGDMEVKNATLAEIANFLQRYVVDRPVLDHSGIEGRYDFQLDWTADDSQFYGRGAQMPKPNRSFEPPDLFTAFREQLGLRLAPKKAPAPVLVVDRVEKPTEN